LQYDLAALELSQFDQPPPNPSMGAGGFELAAVPFRLTRNLLHFVTPLGVDGAFSGAFCAAAECMSQQRKCPLGLWLDLLSRPEAAAPGEDGAGHGLLVPGLVPWGVDPDEATARVVELSPELAVRRRHEAGKPLAVGKGAAADVHAGLRQLIEEATSTERLQLMPPAWQPWL
jgi:hypothetical protein